MKSCLNNNDAAIYVGKAATVQNTLFNVHTTSEYLHRNVSIGQLLYAFENLSWSVYGQGQKNANKNITKKFCFSGFITIASY